MVRKEWFTKEMLNLILPDVLVDYFDLKLHKIEEEELHLYFDEKNNIAISGDKEKVVSKGFYPCSIVQDFPLRGKAVYLHIRRRKWHNVKSKETITRNWKLVAKGTRMTKSFATFLKEAY